VRISPQKLSALVQVEKEVTRGGRTHTQHYWVRGDRDEAELGKAGVPRLDVGPKATGHPKAPKFEVDSSVRFGIQEKLKAAKEEVQKAERWVRTDHPEFTSLSDISRRATIPFEAQPAINASTMAVTAGARVLSHELRTTFHGDGNGLETYEARDKLENEGWLGSCSSTGDVKLRTDQHLAIWRAIDRGKVEFESEYEAFHTLTHELFHSVNYAQSESKSETLHPKSAIEEAITEIDARQYTESIIKAYGLKLNPELHRDAPLYTDSSVYNMTVTRSVAYTSFVQNFGRTVSAIEFGSPGQIGTEQIKGEDAHEWATGWAAKLKSVGADERYETLAERAFETFRVPETAPDYENQKRQLANDMKFWLEGKGPETISGMRRGIQERATRAKEFV